MENFPLSVDFAKEKVSVVKEDTYMRFKEGETMASTKTALFTGLALWSQGWGSQEAREDFTANSAKILPQYTSFKDGGEMGVATKMVVNFWICAKWRLLRITTCDYAAPNFVVDASMSRFWSVILGPLVHRRY